MPTTKPIENLSPDDALAFKEAIQPYVQDVMAEDAVIARGLADNTFPNVYAATLPKGVTETTVTAQGTGGTAGTYTLGVSGGPAGFAGRYVIGSDGKIPVSGGIIIDNPGLASASTALTLSFPWGGITGATATATVGSLIPDQASYYAVSADSKSKQLWRASGGAPVAVLAPSGTQVSEYLKDGLDAAIAIIQQILVAVPGRASFAAVDEAGNLIIQISKELIDHPDINLIREQAAAAYNALFATTAVPQGRESYAVVDGAGNLVIRVSKDAVGHPVIESLLDRVAANEARLGWDYSAADFAAELSHIIGYGQSLMAGGYANPAISTTTKPYRKMFAGGVRPLDGGTDPATIYGSLVPLVEASGGANSSGETPLAGCIDMIAQLLLDENGIDLTAANQQLFLGSNAAMGGKSQAQLALGTTYFDDWKNNVSYGKARADALGISYGLAAALISQGEADYDSSTRAEEWKAGQRRMRLDMQAHARAVSGNNRPLPMVMAQTMTHLNAGKTVPSIAMAQEELAQEQWFACFPIHFMDYYADGVHLPAVSERWQGGYCGLILKRWLVDKIKPTLSPSRVERAGSSVVLTFPVAAGRKLVLDSTMAALTTNYGFTITDAYGAALTISRVALVAPNKIIITPTSGTIGRVRNGWIGTASKGISCVRDDSPLIFDPAGINKPMNLWAGIFERTVA